ncbi:MAG: general secretion pathway protein GspC [Marinobacter sp. 34-60-7]|nr:MAG: general secretion pathway protein GspC [Marinobacter sp. 34-60-7]
MVRLSAERQSRVARSLANILLVILAVFLGVQLAKLTWMFAWQDQPVPAFVPAAGGISGTNGNLAPVSSYELFGRSAQQAGVADVIRRSAPETGLRLSLEGVLVGQRPEDSGAIVSESNGEAAYYRVGDGLPGNAILAEVEPGRVLLRRGGRYESLTFDEEAGLGGTDMVAEAPSDTAESPDAFLAEAREQVDAQGVAALAPYGLQPVDPSGVAGYVYDGSSAMLNAVNLRPGDVILSINGQRLGNLEQDKTLLENWRGQAQLDIEIERDGSILTVSYAIPEQWR